MHLFPDAFVSPTGESFVDAVPIPIFGRKQSPLGAVTVHLQDGLDKPLAFVFLTDVQAGAATQEIENPAPLFCWQLNVISQQGKPPDFVLEIASQSTGRQDVEKKRPAYADLGIPEYWRFDQTREFHGTRLAGDRLADGQYEPIPIEEIEEGVLQGYSRVLNLFRW